MPELPEVETIKNELGKSLAGKRIKGVFVYTGKMIKVGAGRISNVKRGSKSATKEFAVLLKGKRILKVGRRAKFLIIGLSGGYFLVIHLRMSGQLIFLEKAALKEPLKLSLAKTAVKQTLPGKHTHVEFAFSNGSKLFYNDTRQFGHIRLADSQALEKVFAGRNLGPEPLDLSLKEFQKIIAAHPRKRAKDFLLNQKVIAGIGNIYADESLFIAKINPLRKVGSLGAGEIKALHKAIREVLRRAIKLGGSSIEYFLMINGAAGKFSAEHLVYAKAGLPCPECGRILQSKKISSRTSTYCPHCQA